MPHSIVWHTGLHFLRQVSETKGPLLADRTAGHLATSQNSKALPDPVCISAASLA